MQTKRAYSMLEVGIVLVLISILALIGFRMSDTVMRQSNLSAELMAIKGSIQTARGQAIANSLPVEFNFRNDRMYVVSDIDRDGTFGDKDEELIVGEALGAPVAFNYRGVRQTTVASGDVPAISHWSGHADDIDDFPAGRFYISPTGLVRADAGAPAQGAFYLLNSDGFAGAVYVSMLGDVKMAIREAGGGWEWID
ncbi:MAG: type II secretion system protein [Acidobacteria bacterium]|nr:type II secretion system protein [Acidobacteriota bacterium]